MGLNLIPQRLRTLPIVKNDLRYLYSWHRQNHLQRKMNQPADRLQATFLSQPVNLLSSPSASSPDQSSRHFATSVVRREGVKPLKKEDFIPERERRVSKSSIMMKIHRFTGHAYKWPKFQMNWFGIKLYLCCTELVQFDEIFDYLDLDDNYNTYFLILHLHIWMVMTRLAQEAEGEEGDYVMRAMLKSLWEDTTLRTKKLVTKGVLRNRHEAITNLYEQSMAACFAYDEGSLGDDHALAGAIWRIIFQKDEYADPQKIAGMVHYVRKQLAHLDRMPSEVVMSHGIVTFLPFEGDVLEYDVTVRHISSVITGAWDHDGPLGNIKFVKLVADPHYYKLLLELPPPPPTYVSPKKPWEDKTQLPMLEEDKKKMLEAEKKAVKS